MNTTFRQNLIDQAKDWLISNGYQVLGPDRLVDSRLALVDHDTMQRLYRMDFAPFNGRGTTNELRMDALTVAITLLEAEQVAKLAATIAYDPSVVADGIQTLYKWLQLTTGEYTITPEVAAVIQHFIWQVKRKLNNKAVKHHMMPLIYGPQGTGKSMAVARLLEPVSRYMLAGKTVPEMIDARNFKALSQNYVCFFDEMARSEQADIETLKNILSINTINYRPLYTNKNSTVIQNTTFIGASNKDIRNLIKDSTGMRRFFQITCNANAKNKEAWRQARDLDMTLIWKAIDENADEPSIIELLQTIELHQETIRSKNSIEEFMEERDLSAGEERAPLKDVYLQYNQYCQDSNLKPFSKPSFVQELKQAGIETGKANFGQYLGLNRKNAQPPTNLTNMKGAI